jgi:hypothetical protein
LREKVAHARCADANDRLDELGRRHREERDVRLARDRPREQRLAGAGQTREQHAVRYPSPELSVLLGMAQEVDDLRQLRLRLIDPRHVRERDAVARRLVPARARTAERSESVLDVAGTPQQPEQQEDEEDRRPEAEQQVLPPRRSSIQWLGVDDHFILLEQACQGVVIGERGNLGLEERRRLRPCVGHLLVERALDRGALRRDLLDVPHGHLLEKERAVGNADAGRRLRRP